MLVYKKGNDVKRVKVGYSWTMLFFGPFVPLFRSDWKGFLLVIILDIIFTGGIVLMPFSLPLIHVILGFFYNKLYQGFLESEGYKLKSF